MFKTNNLGFLDIIKYNDIEVADGSVTFITGRSGSGKSTLLKLFNGTEDFSRGEIYYKGVPLREYDSIALRKQVKLISQTCFLFPLSIRENFLLFYSYCDYKGDKSDEKLREFLKITAADFSLDAPCATLSGGEKQRVYIAICLSMEAETIMLDEPTSALDPEIATRVMQNIVDYAKSSNKTLIIISHDTGLTQKFSENIVTL